MYIIQQFPSDKKRKQGQFGGISVYGFIKGERGKYYIVLLFADTGAIRLETAVKEKSTYKNKIELLHPMRLTDESAASHGNDNSSISIDRIQEIFRGVKEEQYHQKNKDYTGQKDLIAYHNSNFGNITLLMPQDVVNQKETPLAVDSGMYMQTVQQETADTIKEYSTFDKAGMTMHAIREERTRLSTIVKELSNTKDEREKDSVQSIMDTYFPNETDNTKKEVLQELFAGGVDRLGDNAQEMLSNARTTWGDITGYKQYADYDPKNPLESTSDMTEWYNEAKQAYGHNPNKRELYDVAHKKYVKELQDKSRASLAPIIHCRHSWKPLTRSCQKWIRIFML